MTAPATVEVPTTDELVTAILRRLDDVTERVAASKALSRNEAERHANIADLAAIWAGLLTWQVVQSTLLTPPVRPEEVDGV